MIQKFIRKRGLAFKMIFFIFTAVALLFFSLIIYNYYISKETIERNINRNAEVLTGLTVSRIEKVFSSVQKVPDNFSKIFENSSFSMEEIQKYLSLIVENNTEIYGAAIAFEPYYIDPNKKYFAPYFYKENNKIKFKYLGDSLYEYFIWDWYQIPKELGKPVWSEPYYDEGGGEALMTTYSVPLFKNTDGQKKFIGVLTADVSLDWLQNTISSVKVYETGYAFLISRNGTIITHPTKEVTMNETIFSIAEEKKLPELREVGRKMLRGEKSFAEIEYKNIVTGKLSWMSYSPVPINGWAIAIIYPVDELLADVNSLYVKILLIGSIGLFILLIIIILISRSITSPLRSLSAAAEQLAEGNFKVDLPVINSRDELGRLANSFMYMLNALDETIMNLMATSDELKSSNEKLEEYSRTLEEKVDIRTAALNAKNKELDEAFNNVNKLYEEIKKANKELKEAQAQLVQSEKMASLGQLTAGIAHEIKNPLNFINNFAELNMELAKEINEELNYKKENFDVKTYEYIGGILNDLENNSKKISEHGKRADSIVRGMLLHSRGKSGEMQKTDLNALLNEYVNLAYHGMRAQDSTFNTKIETNFDDSIGMINVIPQDISRVFLNIINNGCYSVNEKKKEKGDKYSPILNISTKNIGNCIEIRIKDNGKGIPQDLIEKVFNPFFTTKPAGKGTGLGLSLSYDIVVQEHKGTLQVESEINEYAEFVIRLPKN